MLAVLRIQNLAVVEQNEVEFCPGLNVLTGETGAGKTIILKAIELLTGKRASSDIIRTGAEQCTVEGLFSLSSGAQARITDADEVFAEYAAADELLVRRVIDRSGRSKIYINGNLGTAALLQALTIHLIDITGQHEQQTLLDPSEQLELLDSFGVNAGLRAAAASSYEVYAKAKHELESFTAGAREQALYLERIRHEAEELVKAKLETGERERLEQELSKLKNVEGLTLKLGSCLELLDGGDAGGDNGADDSLETRLAAMLSLLHHAAAVDPALAEISGLAEGAQAQLSESRLQIGNYLSSLEADPSRLEYLRERIAEIARLERKYQRPSAELVGYLSGIRDEISRIESGELSERNLREKLHEAQRALKVQEEKLTAARKKAADALSGSVERELASVHMKRAQFRVDVLPAPSGPSGADKVLFMLAANVGEAFRPLADVASGGELSRILLVLKSIAQSRRLPETQLFDEIDAGIGGAAAQVVGEKLKKLSRSAQVILITHSAQIAAFAERHFVIEKRVSRGRTLTEVRALAGGERVQQLAGMLAGKQITENFQDSARELLRQAGAHDAPASTASAPSTGSSKGSSVSAPTRAKKKSGLPAQ